MRLVQIRHPQKGRRVAVVEEPLLILVDSLFSMYEWATHAISCGKRLTSLIEEAKSFETILYDEVYYGLSDWTLLPAFDHPFNPHACLVSGTGLTHKMSAESRQHMHESEQTQKLTDSMRMYLWGQQGGRPKPGEIGTQPEWFYKGNGSVLKAHGESLCVPNFGEDGGEESELLAVYVNDEEGNPWRVGFATANEFSDHVMEQRNYLYLAHSKIRDCSMGPELVIHPDFQEIIGKVRIIRKKEILWEKEIITGEKQMVHSLANLEYHHFKYPNHRMTGQVHLHFLGAAALSFGENIKLEEGDIMEINWSGMGRALSNPLAISNEKETMQAIKSLS
ncbi:MAG: AraD1 family protein [Bacteroidota bacterium]